MPHANTKLNPALSMRLLYKEMLKYDSLITVFNPTDDQQIQLEHDTILASEAKFKNSSQWPTTPAWHAQCRTS